MVEPEAVQSAIYAFDAPVVTAEDIAIIIGGVREQAVAEALSQLEDDSVLDSRMIDDTRVWWDCRRVLPPTSAADLDPADLL